MLIRMCQEQIHFLNRIVTRIPNGFTKGKKEKWCRYHKREKVKGRERKKEKSEGWKCEENLVRSFMILEPEIVRREKLLECHCSFFSQEFLFASSIIILSSSFPYLFSLQERLSLPSSSSSFPITITLKSPSPRHCLVTKTHLDD